jgi:hypothetical protein
MLPTDRTASAEAWLEWFAVAKAAQCRAFLCTRAGLDAAEAEALMNTTLLQVFRHWATIEQPLAYFWHTLQQAVRKQGQRRSREQRQLAAYARQQRVHVYGAARTAQHVADVLERVSPHQRRLLAWYAQGYDDPQVAAWLGSRPRRYAWRGMGHIGPSGPSAAHRAAAWGARHDFFGADAAAGCE